MRFGAMKIRRAFITLLFLAGFLVEGAAIAATTPPNYDNRDANGVDRVTGLYYQDMVEGGIGGADGVTMIRYYGETWRDNWSGELVRTASGTTQYATAIFGKTSDRFTRSGSNWVSDKANGATLVENQPDKQFTYTAPDGTTITYESPLLINPLSLDPNPTVPQCGTSLMCAVPVEIQRPSGQKYSLTWKIAPGCLWPSGPGGPIIGDDPPICKFYWSHFWRKAPDFSRERLQPDFGGSL